jgi:hypothetical protein
MTELYWTLFAICIVCAFCVGSYFYGYFSELGRITGQRRISEYESTLQAIIMDMHECVSHYKTLWLDEKSKSKNEEQ